MTEEERLNKMDKFLRAYRAYKDFDIACKKARVSKQTIKLWFKKYEDFYIDYRIIDYTEFAEVESVLLKYIREYEDLKSVFYYLDRKGAKFGYGKAREVEKENEIDTNTKSEKVIYIEKN